jgi:hypothetical protein
MYSSVAAELGAEPAAKAAGEEVPIVAIAKKRVKRSLIPAPEREIANLLECIALGARLSKVLVDSDSGAFDWRKPELVIEYAA